MKKINLLFLLFSFSASSADDSSEWSASIYDKWSDSVVCMHIKQQPSHKGFLKEVKKRNLDCGKALIDPEKSIVNRFKDWTNDDLCRWLDSTSIPNPILEEIISRQLSCHSSCNSNELTLKNIDCYKKSDVTEILIEFDNSDIDVDDRNELPISPALNGIDMSGFIPPKINSMDSRFFFINGMKQEASTTYIDALRSYLESSGQGDAFSLNPQEVSEILIEFDNSDIDVDDRNELPISPGLNGIDMSGFIPPKINSMDSRFFFINGMKQEASTTYIDALRSYLESSGQGDAFSLNPQEVK